MHSAIRQFYKAQKAIAAAQDEARIEALSPENRILQRCIDQMVSERWAGIEKANTDALLYGKGVYRDKVDGTEYVILADFYDPEPESDADG
jgi:hypothetical protein